MSLRTGFPQIVIPPALLSFPSTASANAVHTQLTTISAGTYIANYNYSIKPNNGGANFNTGGYIALSLTNYYGAPGGGAVILAVAECPTLAADEVFRGNDAFTFTLSVDTPLFITATMNLNAGNWLSTTPAGSPVDALMNTFSLFKIA